MSTKWDVPNSSKSSGFTLTPSNIQSHSELNIATSSGNVKLDDEWMKERNVIPDFLASHGIPLDLWQELFDRVNDLWIDQMRGVAMDQYRLETISWYCNLSIAVVVNLFVFASYAMVYRYTSDNNTQSERSWDILTQISMYFFLITHCFLRGVLFYRIRIIIRYVANKFRIEKDASKLMISLSNGRLKQHKLAVEVVRTKLEVNIKKSKDKVINVDMMTGLHFSEEDHCTSYTFSPHQVMDGSHFLFRDDFQLEWLHSRDEVPDFLESRGVPLQVWQKWFDQVDKLLTQRIANFNPMYLRLFNFLFLSVTKLFNFYIAAVLVFGLVLGHWNSWNVFSVDSMFPFEICFLFYSIAFFLSQILIHCIKPAIHKKNDETENAWSELVCAIQAKEGKEFGLNVEAVKCTMHRYISYTGTLGLRFSLISGEQIVDDDIENYACNGNSDFIDERALV